MTFEPTREQLTALIDLPETFGGHFCSCDCNECLDRAERAGLLETLIYCREGIDENNAYDEWLQSIPYDEYLRTRDWVWIRNSIRRLRGYRCQVCNSANSLHVHHRRYPKRRGEENWDDLTLLCRDCHYRFHETGMLVRG